MRKLILAILFFTLLAVSGFAASDEYFIDNLTAGYYLNDTSYDGTGKRFTTAIAF